MYKNARSKPAQSGFNLSFSQALRRAKTEVQLYAKTNGNSPFWQRVSQSLRKLGASDAVIADVLSRLRRDAEIMTNKASITKKRTTGMKTLARDDRNKKNNVAKADTAYVTTDLSAPLVPDSAIMALLNIAFPNLNTVDRSYLVSIIKENFDADVISDWVNGDDERTSHFKKVIKHYHRKWLASRI